MRGTILPLGIVLAIAVAVGSGCSKKVADDHWRTLDPVVRAMNQGVSLMGQFRYAEAVGPFEVAAALAPELKEARVNLAIAYFHRNSKGDHDKAALMLDDVLAQDPENVQANYFRGILHQQAGRAKEAVSFFERVVHLEPSEHTAWYALGVNKMRLGEPAKEVLERAIQENPHLVSAYYHLFQLQLRSGKRKEADVYREAFQKLRENPLADKIAPPNYDQMGKLALVQPLKPRILPPVPGSTLELAPPRVLYEGDAEQLGKAEASRAEGEDRGLVRGGAAVGDVDGDGAIDLLVAAPSKSGGGVMLFRGTKDRRLEDATAGSGLETVKGARSCALGDFDNDEKLDLFVACAGENHLFQGKGDGTFVDVTAKTGGGAMVSRSAVFLDADHDGDLDVYILNAGAPDGGESANQLLNNNGDKTFTDIATEGGVACRGQKSVMVLPGDLDGDRDTDLVVCREGQAVQVFLNDRQGKYHESTPRPVDIRGDYGGVLQDLNGDGLLDLLTLGKGEPPLRLSLGDGNGQFEPSVPFDASGMSVSTWGPASGIRIADVDLDGDIDLAVLGSGGHLLLNDGRGTFALRANAWRDPQGCRVLGTELFDLTGDGVVDVLRILEAGGGKIRIDILSGKLTPPANWLAITPTGKWNKDKGMRSPVSGYGTRIALRAGLHEQTVTYTGLWGGPSQSAVPVIYGLAGVGKADYLSFRWPDGIAQSEIGLVAKTHHRIAEFQRKISSCPVLFSWNGDRFEFVTDFAGVGGLGYFVAPGTYAQPQVLEHVKIEAGLLKPKDGQYELRVSEPMEEVAYVDRLELLAVDHPDGVSVFPDERLAVSGPRPTHKLLVVDEPIFPATATDPAGNDCTQALAQVDRSYAYRPPLDKRFYGFCEPHSLELDFGDRLASLASEGKVYLFVQGYIEYPYSQTVYAASQAGVTWQPMRIELATGGNEWQTIVPDAGTPGGMGRMMTVELPRLRNSVGPSRCKLRITTNIEIHYDQVFIAVDRGSKDITVQPVPLKSATLRYLGFPREYSPDGRHPLLYDYDLLDATAPFQTPRGAYTRYGAVESLLSEFDDRYAIVGPGDEIALRFDAAAAPPAASGLVRSFVLVSHTYCKDMDLYTAASDTVTPLPFRAMTSYPYPEGEAYPDTAAHEQDRDAFHTRMVR